MTGYYEKRIIDTLRCLLFVLITVFAFLQCSTSVLRDREKEDVDRIIRELNSTSWIKREKAAEKLGNYTSKKSTKALINALDDRHDAVIIHALQSLATRKSEKAYDKIRELAKKHRNENVRWYAIKSLAQYRDALDAPIYIDGLESDDWLIREASIVGLLLVEDYSTRYVCLPAIITTLDDPSMSVQIAAIKNLSIIDDGIYKALVKKIDKEAETRSTLLAVVLEALMVYRLDEKTRERVVELLGHRNWTVRVTALRLLKGNKLLQDEYEVL